MQIFVAYESGKPVWFDDLKITHQPALVVQENHYYPFGMNITSLEKSGQPEMRFQYNGKEKQEEFNLNWLDYGARFYDSQLGRWHSVDPKADEMRRHSIYNYAFNNPIIFIDPDGTSPDWIARINESTNKIEFVAEKGDNVNTLSTQLGVSKRELIKADNSLKGKTFSAGEAVGLENLEEVQAINTYLDRSDIDQTNCSNCALAVNSIDQENAWLTDGVDQMEETPGILQEQFENVSESESSIGDVVSFTATKKAVTDYVKGETYTEEQLGFMNEDPFRAFEINRQHDAAQSKPSHYGVVVLKNKDGSGVQSVLEKPGRLPPRISNMKPYTTSDKWSPSPIKGDNNFIYKKK